STSLHSSQLRPSSATRRTTRSPCWTNEQPTISPSTTRAPPGARAGYQVRGSSGGKVGRNSSRISASNAARRRSAARRRRSSSSAAQPARELVLLSIAQDLDVFLATCQAQRCRLPPARVFALRL